MASKARTNAQDRSPLWVWYTASGELLSGFHFRRQVPLPLQRCHRP